MANIRKWQMGNVQVAPNLPSGYKLNEPPPGFKLNNPELPDGFSINTDEKIKMDLKPAHQPEHIPGVMTMQGFRPEPTEEQRATEQQQFTELYKKSPIAARFMNTYFRGYLQSPAGAKLAKSVPPAEGMQHVTELAGHVAFDIPALILAGQMNPTRGIGYLKKLGDVGNFVLREAGFGATFGAIKGTNPATEAAIFVGFGLTGKGLGVLAKKIAPIFKKAESAKAAHKEVMETLAPVEKDAYTKWWENPETQKQLNAYEFGINREANLRRTPEGKKLLTEQLTKEKAIKDYLVQEAKTEKMYEDLIMKKLERPIPKEPQKPSIVKKEEIVEGEPIIIGKKPVKPTTKPEKKIISHEKEVGAERLDFIPKEKVKIPEFKADTQAAAYGAKHKGDKAVIEALKKKETEARANFKSEKDINKKPELQIITQKYREAREVAEGTMPEVTAGVKEVSKKQVVEKAEVSGKDFTKGILEATKKDLSSEVGAMGKIENPYRNLEKFLTENKLKLTSEERQMLIRAASEIGKQGFGGAEKKTAKRQYNI